MTRLCSPRAAFIGIVAIALFVGWLDAPRAAPAKSFPIITFLPISLKVCDAYRKPQPDEVVATVSYMGGRREGWQYVNFCAYQKVKWK